MGKVTIRGVSINYRTLGHGEDVVLIHGLAANQGFWNPAVLMPLVRKCRVTLLDLRGHGHSSMPAKGYSSRELAGDLQALFQYIGIERATLIGHSYGGVVALHIAVLYPDIVKRLVLADTRVRVFQPHLCSREVLENKKFAAKLALLGLQLPENEQETGLWLLEQLAMPKWREKKLLQRAKIFFPFGGWNSTHGHRAADRWLKLMNTTSAKNDFQELAGLTREKIAAVDKPILAICGASSSAVQTQKALQALVPHCQISTIPGAGHFFPLTHANDFIERVINFLRFSSFRERRVHQRYILGLKINVRRNDIFLYKIPTMNVSKTGLLIECSYGLELGGEIEFDAPLDAAWEDGVMLRGKVVRKVSCPGQKGYQCGIELISEGPVLRDWEKYLSCF